MLASPFVGLHYEVQLPALLFSKLVKLVVGHTSRRRPVLSPYMGGVQSSVTEWGHQCSTNWKARACHDDLLQQSISIYLGNAGHLKHHGTCL